MAPHNTNKHLRLSFFTNKICSQILINAGRHVPLKTEKYEKTPNQEHALLWPFQTCLSWVDGPLAFLHFSAHFSVSRSHIIGPRHHWCELMRLDGCLFTYYIWVLLLLTQATGASGSWPTPVTPVHPALEGMWKHRQEFLLRCLTSDGWALLLMKRDQVSVYGTLATPTDDWL